MDHNDSFKNYQIIRKLGSGAFGEVYEARSKLWPPGKPKVAIKIISKDRLNTNTRRRRIAREVLLHSSLPSHPSMLKLLSHFEDSKRVYIITELCPNGNLHRYMTLHPNGLSEAQTRGVMQDIVEELHYKGIMHRDLKLSNILLDKNMHIKIADFGLARIVDDNHREEEYTFCGTANYISPEILNNEPYGIASDIWSLGCTFLTLLTGTPPFGGVEVSVSHLLHRVRNGDYFIPRRLSREATSLVRCMLQRVLQRKMGNLLQDPRVRISTFDILKHPYFDGPIRTLSPPSNGFNHVEAMTAKDESSVEDRVLPSRLVPPKSSSCDSVADLGNALEMDQLQNRGRQKTNPRRAEPEIGLTTVLEEIGVSNDYQQRRSLEHPQQPRAMRYYSDGNGRATTSKLHSRRQREQPLDKNTRRQTLSALPADSDLDNPIVGPYHSSSHSIPPAQQDDKDHIRFLETQRTPDSYTREKEATFERYADEQHNERKIIEPMGDPASGEGLRNALGNLERKLKNRPYIKESNKDPWKRTKEHLPGSREKGFAAMLDNFIPHENGGTDKEYGNIAVRRHGGIQSGLLSLVSKLHHAKDSEIHLIHNPQICVTHAQESNQGCKPLLPSRPYGSRSPMRENETFAIKYAFSTTGIPPLIQKTKHGVVKILKTGQIELILPSISRNTFTISPDSKRISVRANSGIVWRGDVDELPWRWTRVYRYASRFIGVCRTRVPRVTLEMDGIRGRIMLNGDFEGYDVQDATLIRIFPARRTFKVFKLDKDVEHLRCESTITDIPKQWAALFHSCNIIYRQCLRLCGEETEADDGVTARYAPGIGWCTFRGALLQFLFDDGIRMDINLDTWEMLYYDLRSKKNWQLTNDKLPMYAREKLEQWCAIRDVE